MEGISRKITPNFGQNKMLNAAPVMTAAPVTDAEIDEFQKTESKKKKKSILIGAGVTAMLGAYAAVFYRKNIMDFASDFIRKTYMRAEGFHSHAGNTLEMFSVRLARLLDKTLMSSQMFVNFSAMKDSLSNKIARALKLGKLCDKLSATWEKLATKAVKANYSKCEKSLTKTQTDIAAIVKQLRKTEDLGRIVQVNGKNYTVGQLISYIEKDMVDARKIYKQGFSAEAFENRKTVLKDRLKDVNEKFYDAYTSFDYYKKLGFTRFTVEEWLAPVKHTYQSFIMKQKMAISNNIDDKFLTTYDLLKNVDKMISPRDTASRKILNDVFKKLKNYRMLSGINENSARQHLTNEIETALKLLTERTSTNHTYSEEALKNIGALIEEVRLAVNMGEKGKLQEVLTYLKAILPKSEYKKIRKQVYDTSEQLNKVSKAEGDLYFDKLRDIVLGSAFTDIVFGMFTPLATMGMVLAMDDTKEERVSTALRLGIPLLGGIATSTAFLFLLASGAKAMLLSSAIGLGLNRIGTYTDRKLVQNREKEEKNPKLNALIGNVNKTSAMLSTDPVSLAVDKFTAKSADILTNVTIDTVNKLSKRPETPVEAEAKTQS